MSQSIPTRRRGVPCLRVDGLRKADFDDGKGHCGIEGLSDRDAFEAIAEIGDLNGCGNLNELARIERVTKFGRVDHFATGASSVFKLEGASVNRHCWETKGGGVWAYFIRFIEGDIESVFGEVVDAVLEGDCGGHGVRSTELSLARGFAIASGAKFRVIGPKVYPLVQLS